MNNYTSKEYEEEINLIDLFWKLVINIKWMVLAGVVFALLVGVAKFGKDMLQANAAAAVEEADPQAVMEDLEDELTIEQIDQVKFINEMMVDLGNRKESTDKSVLMNIDATEAGMVRVDYMVKSEVPEMNVVLSNTYDKFLRGEEVAGLISSALGGKYNEDQVLELIDFGVSHDSMTDNANSNYMNTNPRFSMLIPGDVDAQIVIDTVDKAIKAKCASLSKADAHEVILVSEGFEDGGNYDLTRYQGDRYYDLYYTNSNLISYKASLTEQQLSYLDCLNAEDEEKGDLPKSKDEDKEDAAAKPSISIKFIAIGFILGVFLVCAWVCALFIFSVKLNSPEKFTDRFGGQMFGAILNPTIKDRRKVTRSIEDKIKNTADSIVLYCKQNEITKLALIGTDLDKLNADYLTKVIDTVVSNGVEVVKLGNIYYDSEALVKCADIGKAVVAEGVDISIYDEIGNMIIKANEYKIDLIGSVIL